MSEVAAGLVRQRRRRSRAEAEQLVREYEASGLPRQVFCSRHGLSVASLDKYRRQQGVGVPAAGRMVAVEVVPGVRVSAKSAAEARSALVLELANGRRIAVERGFDPGTLERLVAVLERM